MRFFFEKKKIEYISLRALRFALHPGDLVTSGNLLSGGNEQEVLGPQVVLSPLFGGVGVGGITQLSSC